MEQIRKKALQDQIAEAVKDQEFCAALLMCENAEKVCQLLAKHNIEATPAEIDEFKNDGDVAMRKVKESEGQELSLEQLEEVAGGSKFLRGVTSIAGGAILGFGLGCLCGVSPALTPAAYKIAVGYSVGAALWISQG